MPYDQFGNFMSVPPPTYPGQGSGGSSGPNWNMLGDIGSILAGRNPQTPPVQPAQAAGAPASPQALGQPMQLGPSGAGTSGQNPLLSLGSRLAGLFGIGQPATTGGSTGLAQMFQDQQPPAVGNNLGPTQPLGSMQRDVDFSPAMQGLNQPVPMPQPRPQIGVTPSSPIIPNRVPLVRAPPMTFDQLGRTPSPSTDGGALMPVPAPPYGTF